MKMQRKMSSAKCLPFCPRADELITWKYDDAKEKGMTIAPILHVTNCAHTDIDIAPLTIQHRTNVKKCKFEHFTIPAPQRNNTSLSCQNDATTSFWPSTLIIPDHGPEKTAVNRSACDTQCWHRPLSCWLLGAHWGTYISTTEFGYGRIPLLVFVKRSRDVKRYFSWNIKGTVFSPLPLNAKIHMSFSVFINMVEMQKVWEICVLVVDFIPAKFGQFTTIHHTCISTVMIFKWQHSFPTGTWRKITPLLRVNVVLT